MQYWTSNEMNAENFFGTPTQGVFCSNPSFQDKLATLQDDTCEFGDSSIMEPIMVTEEDMRVVEKYNRKTESTKSNKERVLTFEEISQHFSMPIIEAAKELNVGLSVLKKKCRELGISRWPHRKIRSIQAIIKTMKELGWKEGSVGDIKVRIEELEQEEKLMMMRPSVRMNKNTKKVRQACFKANYMKREKLVA